MPEQVARHETAERVARYYDRNTTRFLLFGGSRGSYSIHRELWGPGVDSAREAAEYANVLVGDEIERFPTHGRPTVFDFGCGVGGTLFHLAERFPEARLRGITVSPRQGEIAMRLARNLGFEARCSFSVGDFTSIRLPTRASVIIAIESLSHASSQDAFLAGAVDHLQPNGRVIVLDDFLAGDEDGLDARGRGAVGRLRKGWRLQALGTLDRLIESAARFGLELEREVDLTPLVRPYSRVRDRVVAWLGPFLSSLRLSGIPFFGNIIGGSGLQSGLVAEALGYRLAVFRSVE